MWDYFAKDIVGKQLVKAVDSVAANLSEANDIWQMTKIKSADCGRVQYNYEKRRHKTFKKIQLDRPF